MTCGDFPSPILEARQLSLVASLVLKSTTYSPIHLDIFGWTHLHTLAKCVHTSPCIPTYPLTRLWPSHDCTICGVYCILPRPARPFPLLPLSHGQHFWPYRNTSGMPSIRRVLSISTIIIIILHCKHNCIYCTCSTQYIPYSYSIRKTIYIPDPLFIMK